MRAAWAALSLLLLPGLGRRATPAATAATMAEGTAGTALGTPGTGTPGTGTPGTGTVTPGVTPGTAGTPGTGTGTPGVTPGTAGVAAAPPGGCGSAGNGTGGDPGDPGDVSAAFVTCPNLGVATELARALVQSRLAACVNIVPGVTSVYTWQGKLEEDSEVLLMIKTRSSRVPALSDFVRCHHPYEVPEVVALPVAQGNPPYLRWVLDSVPP